MCMSGWVVFKWHGSEGTGQAVNQLQIATPFTSDVSH